MTRRRGITVVETLIAIVAATGVIAALVMVQVNSASQIASGGANLTNLQEAGRIFATLRADLDRAASIAPPYDDDASDALRLALIDEAEGGTGVTEVRWAFEPSRGEVTRTAGGERRVFGHGRVVAFAPRVSLLPAARRLADAQKCVVEVRVELAHAGTRAGDATARNFKLSHVISPYNLNLRLKSRREF